MFRTWKDVRGNNRTLRRRVEGPARCCKKKLIAPDMLVQVERVKGRVLATIRQRFPHLSGVPPKDIYLCDGCRETLRREGLVGADDMPSKKHDRWIA